MPVVEALYEAAIIPELWGKALDEASSAWNADGVILSSAPDCLAGLIHSKGMADLCGRFIDDGWYKRDIRAERGLPLLRRSRTIVTDQDLFSADELKQIPFYTEFLASVGFGWFAGTLLAEAGGAQIALSLHRRAHRAPFQPGDLASFRGDLRHVQRAAHLASRARLSYAEGLMDGFERFACGAVLIDRLGRVLRVNRKAENYLGTDLQIVSSRLKSPQREANKSLQDLVAACTRPVIAGEEPGPSWAVLRRSHDLPLLVHSYPVARQANDLFQGARAILVISNPGEERPLALNLLEEVFRLTPAELRVAAALSKGLDTGEIAEEHGVGAQTIRYHLKSIFAKTGAHHQAQLVGLLAHFPEYA